MNKYNKFKTTSDLRELSLSSQAIRHYESGLISREELSVKIKTIKLETKHEKELIKLRERQSQQWEKLRDKHEIQLHSLLKEKE